MSSRCRSPVNLSWIIDDGGEWNFGACGFKTSLARAEVSYNRAQNPDIAIRDRLYGTGRNVFARVSYTF